MPLSTACRSSAVRGMLSFLSLVILLTVSGRLFSQESIMTRPQSLPAAQADRAAAQADRAAAQANRAAAQAGRTAGQAGLPALQVGRTAESVPGDPSLFTMPPPDDAEGSGGKKSVPAAAAYSLLLPGMGELYAGGYSSGKYFTIAEGVLWIALGSVQWYASWIQTDARAFAAQHAGIVQQGQSDQYFSDIGNFDNTYLYNQEILRERQAYKTYDPRSSNAWDWDNGVNREQYRQLRVSSDEMYNNTRFIGAAILFNHLASAINAARLVISHNKEIDQSSSFDLHAGVIGGFAHPSGILISFSKTF